MMDFVFIGDSSGHGPVELRMFGYVFPKGEPVSVVDENVIAKLSQNGHFEIDDSVIDVKPEKSLEAMTKLELEALGREHGIELDRREKKSSLIEQLQEAINAD